MEAIVNYTYTGTLEIKATNVLALLKAAHELRIRVILNWCGEFLEELLDVQNALGIMQISQVYSLEKFSRAVEFIAANFSDVVKNRDFLTISVDEVIIPIEEIMFVIHCFVFICR